MPSAPQTLIVACGALAHEIVALIRAHGWDHFSVQCLPAELHNRPGEIPGAVRDKIRAMRAAYDHVFVAYADCGTGGKLDAVLADEGVERLPGAHCYEFFAGPAQFAALADEEPGTFYLTDFLARHFDRLVVHGMGLDRYPGLESMLFGNYQRLVYLAQTDSVDLQRRAQAAAERLGLDYEYRFTGYGDLERKLGEQHGRSATARRVQWHPS
jgi:hypothetical protein